MSSRLPFVRDTETEEEQETVSSSHERDTGDDVDEDSEVHVIL